MNRTQQPVHMLAAVLVPIQSFRCTANVYVLCLCVLSKADRLSSDAGAIASGSCNPALVLFCFVVLAAMGCCVVARKNP